MLIQTRIGERFNGRKVDVIVNPSQRRNRQFGWKIFQLSGDIEIFAPQSRQQLSGRAFACEEKGGGCAGLGPNQTAWRTTDGSGVESSATTRPEMLSGARTRSTGWSSPGRR